MAAGGVCLARFGLTQRRLLFFAIAVVCLHLGANALFRTNTEFVSYFFFLFWSLLAASVCFRRAVVNPRGMSRNWILLSLGLFLWFVGTILAMYAEFYAHANPAAASIDDFFYFFYGIPILLAIAAQDEGGGVSIFFWLDGFQAITAGCLAYIAIFGALPLTGVPTHPLSVTHLIQIYDVENLILALAATARLAASPRGSDERRFFRILVTFLWTYTVFSAIYNRIVEVQLDAGMLDLIVDIPFALLIVAATRAWRPIGFSGQIRSRKPFAMLIDNGRPLAFALALVALGGVVAHSHFLTGMAGVLLAFAVYGLRSTILQSRYLQAQQALEVAKDRLEEIAMLDGLTGIANRRCFDLRLQLEWNRAIRTESTISLLMIDIDFFKKLNDTFGHQAGDECLIQVAATLRKALNRPGDLLARYGGEEFVALLPETDAPGAKSIAHKMNSLIGEPNPATHLEYSLTISVGCTTCDPSKGGSPQQIVETADRAMYLAKQNGRNRVEVLDLPPSSKL
jgi:diguanylate cyclase (GGDEF)-like protein